MKAKLKSAIEAAIAFVGRNRAVIALACVSFVAAAAFVIYRKRRAQ